jgi:3-dehydroquinate dehydratase II
VGGAAYRIEVLHGVNLDMLGRRDPAHYGTLTLPELELRIGEFAAELGLQVRCFQTNAESELVERLHRLGEQAAGEQTHGIVLNLGAWTHYAWAIHDALEIPALPAVEVHLSDIKAREPWRRVSVIEDLCLSSISGQGPEGYRLALRRLRSALAGGASERQPEDAP